MATYSVVLEGGAPWGFRMKGGRGTGLPLVVSKINPESKASIARICIGDTVESINGQPTNNLDHNDAQNLIRNTSSSLALTLSKAPSLNGPVINNNNNMSVQTSASVSESPDEPPPPRMLGANNNQYPMSPTSPTSPKQGSKPIQFSPSHQPQSPSYAQSAPYAQSPPKQDNLYQPVRPQRAEPVSTNPGLVYDAAGESWPAPPPPLSSPSQENPRQQTNPGTWTSPDPNPAPYQAPIENKGPTAWSPAGPSSGQPKSFKPVKLDLNPKPKPWKPAPGTAYPQEAPAEPSSPPSTSTWQPSPSKPTHQAPGPATNGDVHSPYHPVERQQSNPAQSSPYQPVDRQQANPAQSSPYQPLDRQQSNPSQSSPYQPVDRQQANPAQSSPYNPVDHHQSNPSQSSPYRPADRHHNPGAPTSPYRPADPQQDLERYNPGYQPAQSGPAEPPQRYGSQPLSPQDTKKPEMRPVPDGYGSGLPRSVSPTVTLLQYQREREKDQRSQADYLPADKSLMPPPLMSKAPSIVKNQPAAVVTYPLHAGANTPVITDHNDLPEGAVFQKQTIDGDVIHTDTYYPVKTRQMTKKTIHKEAPQYEGIGPKDETGLPIGLRAHVKEENRHDWYKEMFKTIHKQDKPEEDIDQSYMDALLKEANTYEPSYAFPADVKENEQWSHDPTMTSSPPRSPPTRKRSPNSSARNTIDRYHQQPRSIIDYEPGKSSLAEKEKLPTAQHYNPPVEPISAVQNAKRSTTLPRDFAQFNQVPAESPSAKQPPPKQEEPIRQSSRPLSSTLPRAKTRPRSMESSGLSAAERLGIKSPPPQRTTPAGSKPSRHSSGSDKIYNYRDPPPTLDKTKAERVIEEERRKREYLQAEEAKQRRHSDYTPIKSPIITNDRFRDPVINAKDDNRKQEIKACAIALYPFKAQTHKELSFDKGDIIYLLRKIDKNWYEGEHHGHAGIFPSSYVEVVTSLEDAKQAQGQGPALDGKARAKYRFTGETPMELNFNKGEYIVLLKKVDANWWEGSIGDRKGIFPATYVEVLREPTAPPSAPSKSQPAPSQPAYQPHGQQAVQSSPITQQRQQTSQSSPAARPSLGSSGSQGSYPGSQREPERFSEELLPKPSQTLAADRNMYRAAFAYMPQNDDEIELHEGDAVNVLEKCDDGWYVGMSERTGLFGTFPGNYVIPQ